jgi:hypothetical protein
MSIDRKAFQTLLGGRRWRVAVAVIVIGLFALGGVAVGSSSQGGEAGRCPSGSGNKPPTTAISKIQSLQLELMRRSSFNSFDGTQVARDLLAHRLLWCGAMMDRLGGNALIKLRDIGENAWNVDTLYVLSSTADDKRLTSLARRWHPDSVTWVSGPAASRLLGATGSYRILEVWWD